MTSDRLARFSLHMATLTLLLIVAMLLLNTVCWLYPNPYGFCFGLTDRMLSNLAVDITVFPMWQKFGGIVLSSIPLLALALGLNHLRRLFQSYGQGDYFSSQASTHLGRVGRAVALWVVLDFVCEPLLSMWLTLYAPPGQHLITLSITPPYFVALFLAACIVLIAHILQQASAVNAENKTFV